MNALKIDRALGSLYCNCVFYKSILFHMQFMFSFKKRKKIITLKQFLPVFIPPPFMTQLLPVENFSTQHNKIKESNSSVIISIPSTGLSLSGLGLIGAIVSHEEVTVNGKKRGSADTGTAH